MNPVYLSPLIHSRPKSAKNSHAPVKSRTLLGNPPVSSSIVAKRDIGCAHFNLKIDFFWVLLQPPPTTPGPDLFLCRVDDERPRMHEDTGGLPPVPPAVNATQIWVRNNGTGTFHGYPKLAD
jgi:hypothetical protein